VPALMVQGTSSWAGKSLITTALARAIRRRGVGVVPFKAQNMSNNARVARGGEIGSAQYFQALAADVEPDVHMNPVLVKPEGDNQSQVVVLGRPDLKISRLPWRARGPLLWPVIERSLHQMLSSHELVLIEGAGSPAETNLRDTDLANMRTAVAATARVLLVADIDRGGAFAHLYGTWAMLTPRERELLLGFVLNKFRGDPTLLPPAPEQLRQLTGVPTVGVIPWLTHRLPDEDGAADPIHQPRRLVVGVIRYPTASNLDEFKLLEQVADLRWLNRPGETDSCELVILPGSKHVVADLFWLRASGMADEVVRRVRSGRRVLGICGGLQMLGERIDDDASVDGSADGLGILPLKTAFVTSKRAERIRTRFSGFSGEWKSLAGRPISGYEIRHGRSTPTGEIDCALPDGLGFVKGNVLAIYLHGLFEEPTILGALFAGEPREPLEVTFDKLADAVEEHLDVGMLLREAGIG
jgi:adenosylcobyric acid synthase